MELTYAQWKRRQDAKRKCEQVIRRQIFEELMRGMNASNPDSEYRRDHEEIGKALLFWASWETLEQMPELNRWPETYAWLKKAMEAERL